ncbi:AAK [Lepeophtheirus salmonis]|uniref:AAK n=1 Tax=Lepeophtheirus salmonis TaxID=72036 RepID=A0A7R8H2Q0_LEPSM|nr:AAK [Lepeophtheirus salmonis]CAF2818621.1 AAK [Lepeophtheirus salmonis]
MSESCGVWGECERGVPDGVGGGRDRGGWFRSGVPRQVWRRSPSCATWAHTPHLIGYVDSRVSALKADVCEVLLLMPYHATTLLSLMNEKMKSGGFAEEEIVEILMDICLGVGRLHHCSTPIIHRDLKVENILRSDEGAYIICDFGSATSRILNSGMQGINQVEDEIKKYTTLPYRAPEMVDLYSNKPLTPKLDIWALGCFLLYNLCFFSLPFGESTLAIQSGVFTFPKRSIYSDKLHKLIRYLLTPDVEERPDIFQATYLTYSIAEKECPLQNLNNADVPHFDNISLIDPSDTKVNQVGSTLKLKSTESKRSVHDDRSDTPTIENKTTITPRQRPKANKSASGSHTLPIHQLDFFWLVTNSQKTCSNPFMPCTTNSFQFNHVNPFFPPEDFSSVPMTLTKVETVKSENDINGCQSNSVGISQSKSSLHKCPGGWNPFSESKFSQLSEDALFGVQFDKIREEMYQSRYESYNSKRDPFGSAPFSFFKKDS